MTIRPVLVLLVFATWVLSATAAAACMWNDASNGSDPSKVASTAPTSGDQQPQPSKTN